MLDGLRHLTLVPLRRFSAIVIVIGLMTIGPVGICFSRTAHAALLTVEEIKRISPNIRPEYVQAIIDAENEFIEAKINTKLRLAHFLTQVMTETGGLKRLDENMNYSYGTLLRVFSRKTISEAKAREIQHKPVQIANWVYGGRQELLNKGRHTNDGWDYRGSGYIQLTGRGNFRARGKEIGIDLEGNPELARQSKAGLKAAIAYWRARNINAAADDNDLKRVRILVNGPKAHGYPQSVDWFEKSWNKVFRNKPGLVPQRSEEFANEMVVDERSNFDEMLKQGGLLNEGFESSANPDAERTEALKQFQRELGLPETGQLDEATKEELLDPREWRYLDQDDDAPARPEDDLEQTHAFSLGTATGAGLAEVASFSGIENIAKDTPVDQEDKLAMEKARAIYSEYEMADAVPEAETFRPFSVIGNDDRVAMLSTAAYPARAVVQILFQNRSGSQYLCSGALISKDTVLTAAHCIHSGTSAGQPYENFRVIPGRNVAVAPFGRCHASHAFVLSGWIASRSASESRNYDLGALKLDCDIGSQVGWFGVRALKDDEVDVDAIVRGYAADKAPPGRQWIGQDKIRVLWEFKGFHQIDTFGGTSGAPVLLETQKVQSTEQLRDNTDNVLIGVHTNGLYGTEEPWKSNNAFTRITPARLARIHEWIDY